MSEGGDGPLGEGAQRAPVGESGQAATPASQPGVPPSGAARAATGSTSGPTVWYDGTPALTAAVGITLACGLGFAAAGWQMRGAVRERAAAIASEREALRHAGQAVAARDGAVARKRQADATLQARRVARERLTRELAELAHLSDSSLIEALGERRSDLGPQGWKLPVLRQWLDAAGGLRDRLPLHEAAKQRLARQARLSPAESWQLGRLRQLVVELRSFVEGIAEVEDWRASAQATAARETRFPARWRSAIEAVNKHPKYGGLALKPQEGLMPLEPDPASTLWEFAHLPTGKPPVRGADGKWIITGQTCVVLVLIPGGTFRMGASDGDAAAKASEKPAHNVSLSPFLIGKYELTQGQWMRLTGKNPSRFRPPLLGFTLAHPVEQVSWEDCRRCLARGGLTLPTDAQWECAARGGTGTPWWIARGRLKEGGNVAERAYTAAGFGERGDDWHDGHARHAPVGRFLPNGFGLHDVIGNVYEWCRDPYHERAYDLTPGGPDGWRDYPDQPQQGKRSRRGGSWDCEAQHARSSRRNHTKKPRESHIGVRAARPVQ